MKKRRISTYIIALLTMSSLFGFPTMTFAQKNEKTKVEDLSQQPFYQGTMLGVDIFGILGKAFGNEYKSAEANIECNLLNRYFPVFEVGYGSTDTVNEETDIHYKTSAPYFRIGAGYNIFSKKPYLPGKMLVGARLGFSSFSYDVDAPSMNDPVWGETSIPVSYQGVKSNASWLELVAEVRTNVYKNFHLGFSVRYKSLFSVKKSENSEPWYIPGYGKNKSSGFGITYNISYKFPF